MSRDDSAAEEARTESSGDGASGDLPSALLREIARVHPATQEPPELLGRTLGHFEVGPIVGRGGMGVVYQATDVRLGRRVALKVLFAWSGDAERRARFLREARTAAAVTHPHTATVLDIGEAEGLAFIAMELLPGPTLRRMLTDAGGRFEPARAVRVARDVASGLARLHAAGIVHRDLKPENVMRGEDDNLKIVDFGLARQASTTDGVDVATEEGRILGTPSYMSPEQTRGERLDARSDVFSFGILLYEMLTGVRPFKGRTPEETAIKTDRDAPEPPSKFVPELGGALEQLVLRCLEKDPEKRFASAEQVATALAALPESGMKEAGKGRPVWVAAAALVALGLGAAFALSSSPSPPRAVAAITPPAVVPEARVASAPPAVDTQAPLAASSPVQTEPRPNVPARATVVAPSAKSKPRASSPGAAKAPSDDDLMSSRR